MVGFGEPASWNGIANKAWVWFSKCMTLPAVARRVRHWGFRYNPGMAEKELSHLDESGRARMVDVGNKAESERVAKARAAVKMSAETLALLRKGDLGKGDVRAAAELAGVMAAKRTSELIPLCHPLPLTHIKVDLEFDDELPGVQITSSVSTVARTGVEMEALTAAAVAGLTVYDMIKAVERSARIVEIRLLEKRGGRSGDVVLED
jgi:cyclic pyranopterin phosphate synthase